VYWCDVCGFGLTGAKLKASPIIHIVRIMKSTSTGRPQEIKQQFGGTGSEDGETG
jgi:hypothetical protein